MKQETITLTILLPGKLLAYLTLPADFNARDLYWLERHLGLWRDIMADGLIPGVEPQEEPASDAGALSTARAAGGTAP